jgi:hypothetical protein
LFLPLSASFMTDVPGLLVIVLCLYLCQRALAARTDRAAIGWLVAAAATNVVGGTARQVAWLGVLVMVPCTGWLMRKRRGVMLTTVMLWMGSICMIWYCQHWFKHQPYSINTPIFPKLPSSLSAAMVHSLLAAVMLESVLFSLLLFVFPVLVAWLPHFGKKLDHYLALVCAGLLPLGAVAIILGSHTGVWPPLILIEELATRKDGSPGWKFDVTHGLISAPFQILISLITIAAFFGLLFAFQDRGWSQAGSSKPSEKKIIFWLLLPFSCCYLLLLLPMIWQGLSFDRYMLGVMPCAIIGLIWLHQECIAPQLPKASVALVVVYAVVAVAGTHNYFAWQRARLNGIRELRDAGVARTEIQAGFAYDGWTQASVGGYVHNSAITYPLDAQRAQVKSHARNNPCVDDFLSLLSEIRPKYAVGYAPPRCYLPSRFPAVHYTAWLPPFHRVVEVQRVPARK